MYTLMFLFWIVLNGRITLEIIIFGLGLTFLIGLLMKTLFGYDMDREKKFLKKISKFTAYLYFLLKEIIAAAGNVMMVILNHDIKVEPELVTFNSGLKTRFGNFVLANSITLTPGTITVSLKGNRLTVHCLRRDFLSTDEMIRRIKEMEKD